MQVPAPLPRIEGDVVPHRAAYGPRRPLITAVGEANLAGKPVASVGPVRQMRQRRRQFQLQPACVGMDADGLVPPSLVGLPVRADEPPRGIPPHPPCGLGQAGVLQVVAIPQQLAAAADDADPPVLKASLQPSQTSGEHLPTTLLLPVLGPSGIAPHSSPATPNWSGQAPVDDPDRTTEVHACIVEVAPALLPLVVRGSRQRARPPRRGRHGQDPLAVSSLIATTAQSATCGKIGPSKLAKVPTDGAQHQLVSSIYPEPGSNASSGRWRDQKRRSDRTHVPHPME